jgi:uncharacterized membrane protein YbhN (UPF0104 family)
MANYHHATRNRRSGAALTSKPSGEDWSGSAGAERVGGDHAMPEELNPRHLRARLLQLATLIALVVLAILVLPGLGQLRDRLREAAPGWLALAVVLELLSTLSYVLEFRAVFCARMSWRMSYQIGMAEQAANALLPAGGAGGLALGAWALSRGGMSAGHIARRTIAFFVLTSLANVSTLLVFAAAFAVGLIGGDRAAAVTYAFGGASAVAIAVTLSVPRLTARHAARRGPLSPTAGRIRIWTRGTVDALGDGVRDGLWLLRNRPVGVLIGSFGYMGFDIAVLGFCFRAFGHSPSVGVLIVAYLIGQLGGLLPLPGGIGGIEGGLIGIFVVYHVPIAAAAVAILAYRVLQLWIPAVLGSIAFVQLRNNLRREAQPAVICQPLADPMPLGQASNVGG